MLPRAVALLARAAVLSVVFVMPATTADQVFLSATGKKYHRQNCRTLKYKPKPISRKEAEKNGYVACMVCHP